MNDEILTLDRLRRSLENIPIAGRWLIGFSGGADSLALLLALKEIQGLGHPILVVHIDHGLQAQANDWARWCAHKARQLDVDIKIIKVRVDPKNPGGSEAAAREVRYAAMAHLMEAGDVLLTAHHRNDQAETLLLQLLRGSGPAGLASMPGLTRFSKGWLARPLLTETRQALRAFLKQREETWVEDHSNEQLYLDRNYLRQIIIPLLQERWPSLDKTLSRAAIHQADAWSTLILQGRRDLIEITNSKKGTLSISELSCLPWWRARNALRIWLHDRGLPLPDADKLSQIREAFLYSRKDSSPYLHWANIEIRRYRNQLYIMPTLCPHDPAQIIPWPSLDEPVYIQSISRELTNADLRTPLQRLSRRDREITIRFRLGGERCKLPGMNFHHSLKKLFQNEGIPAWERDRIPLLYINNELREVIGYWICESDRY